MTSQKNLTLSPTLSQKEEKSTPHPQQLQQYPPTDHPLPKENTTATVKCRLTTENVAANAKLLSEKMTTDAGLCTSLKTLDRRLDKMFDSPKVTHAFSVLREKMEKDFKTKQLEIKKDSDSVTYVFRKKQLKVNYDDNRMYFDTRDNYVSPETMRAKYKQICNTKEYLEAKKSLLLK
jgi:hypothetical protein